MNEISVNEAQIQLSTLSTQYVAEFSIQVFFLPAHKAVHVARALINNLYIIHITKNDFYFFGDSALLCGLPGRQRPHFRLMQMTVMMTPV